MTKAPLLSYIVLSYNYEGLIGTTLRSILDQTVQDFEIVIVDDASQDDSLEVIRAFGDPRIRLLVNEQNLGGAGSYNRAVSAAHGEWLVNLDADDWIAPNKAERQLAVAAADPGLDIIGSYVSVVDVHGARHPDAPQVEAHFNAPYDLALADSWIGTNCLCRSSTMIRRATHLRIGLDDATMMRAPDYELWTRALSQGCRFRVVPEQLTFMRLHSSGVTFGDPLATMLELSYAMLRNLVPLCEANALNPTFERIVAWTARHPHLSALRPVEIYRLLGMLMTSPSFGDFASFRAALSASDGDPVLRLIGRRCLVLTGDESTLGGYARKLERDVQAFVAARDYWQQQYEAALESRDFWRGQSEGRLTWRLVRLARRAYSRFSRSS